MPIWQPPSCQIVPLRCTTTFQHDFLERPCSSLIQKISLSEPIFKLRFFFSHEFLVFAQFPQGTEDFLGGFFLCKKRILLWNFKKEDSDFSCSGAEFLYFFFFLFRIF